MPVAYKGTCYPDEASAMAAACVGDYPQSGSDQAGSWSVACQGVNTNGLTLDLVRYTEGGASAPVSLIVGFSECDFGALNAEPTAEALGAFFALGFVGVLICHVVAWGANAVLDAIGRG